MEHPILFSTPMVKALLEGKKTQTRRCLKFPQPLDIMPMVDSKKDGFVALMTREPNHGQVIKCRYGNIGDKLWVRETWCLITGSDEDGDPILYKANTEDANEIEFMKARGEDVKWHPSIFMPRWASRLTLEITDIRVQRLQEISLPDIEAEGIDTENYMPNTYDDPDNLYLTAKDDYKSLWDSINGKTHPWESNPWVWAISFKVMEGTK